MARFLHSPRLLRGAIVGVDPANPLASTTIFQYNPSEMTRSLQAQITGGDKLNQQVQVLRLAGAPEETISLDVEIDAADQLETSDSLAVSHGIYPQLSALEMLIYPKAFSVINNLRQYAMGSLEILPPAMPLTLFIWGRKRVLPVRITSFSITEQAYDSVLNPIQARASLSLQVLSYNDLSPDNPAYYVFLAHQAVKETMAVLNNRNSAQILIRS
jgi:hypothetical protein